VPNGRHLLAATLLSMSSPARGQAAATEVETAKPIQCRVLGVDSHNDTAQRILIEDVDIGQRPPGGTVDLARLREGGMHVPFFALWVPTYFRGAEAVRRTLDLRDAMRRVFDKYPDRVSWRRARMPSSAL
jgi:hypothetical protein